VSGDIVGVDCMESEEGLVVHEVNNTVEFKNMVKVTGENIPAQIVEYLRSKATRRENGKNFGRKGNRKILWARSHYSE
jgi:hypothetical protein